MKEIDWEERHFRICLALLANPKVTESISSGLIAIKKADRIIKFLKESCDATGSSPELIRKESVGYYGFTDQNGKWVIDPIYDDAGIFSDGLAAVCVDNQYGYIDESENFVIEPKFTVAYAFDNGVAFAAESRHDLLGLIDKNGKWLHDPIFSRVFDFKDSGYARVQIHPDYCDDDERCFAWIDRTGNLTFKKP